MKKNYKKWISIIFFTIAAILSAIFMGKVAINYNLSDYLDDTTQTKIALNIIENEFGMTSNVQVMASNVTTSEAEEMVDKIEDIQYVINVNFDKYDENYYKDNNALFIIIVDGDDYSEHTKYVVEQVKSTLSVYEGIEYGGTAIDKQHLQDSITSEMVYIIAISLCLATAILLLTSSSWIEPIILLTSAGVAILINRGTNFFFGEISYITNSISAILQLALSIDYCIVLLHAFRKEKETESDNNIAMHNTIKKVIKPISASSLTTIAGLLALLFMSFKIGFDIGIVLIKGIVISLITSLTLLPSLILLTDKLMNKTKKKAIHPKGKFFATSAFKSAKFVAPIALIVIVLCGFIQTNNTYIFSDTSTGNENISEIFGNNNSVVVVYKNTDNNNQKEELLINKLNNYKTLNGDKVLATYTAYSNTVEEIYNVDNASKKLDLTDEETKLLFTMYDLYNSPNDLTITFNEFIDFSNQLINTDLDAKEFVDQDIKTTLETIIAVKDILNSDLNADELYQKLSSDTFKDNNISLFTIKQLYGLYFYNSIEDNKVDFSTMLQFIIMASSNENIKTFFDEETISQLKSLLNGINQFESQMELEMTKSMFQGWFYQNTNTMLSDEQLTQIYTNYFLINQIEEKDTIPFLSLLNFLVQTSQITDEQLISTINNYNTLYQTINNKYAYNEFISILSKVAYSLTNQIPTINITDEAIQQIYILYFYQIDAYTELKINGKTFINYILNISKENNFINQQLDTDMKNKLNDMLTINKYLTSTEKLNYQKQSQNLNALKDEITSNIKTSSIDEDKISGVYIKYSIYNNKNLYKNIKACDLLDFIIKNMDTNSLLKQKLDNQKREKISDAQNKIDIANNLLVNDNYSRMLLSINLPNESEETTEFIEYLSNEVKEIFGEEAYITGEIVSTYDLKQSFAYDNKLITIFTLVSIFVIVMIVFKSFSLPVILVAIIQGAIFIAMSTQIFSSGIFFMSYIVATCILMGSTIDYGILMSSNYVQYRKQYTKKDALILAIEAAMPTIFTSGLILTICGFVIHFVSSQNSISTVGLLLGIGTISSVIMIVVVLPCLLYLLDKFVIKFTINK